MNRCLGDAIKNFLSSDKNTEVQMATLLEQEIRKVLKQQTTSSYAGRKYNLVYEPPYNKSSKDKLPDFVELYGCKKEFHIAVNELFIHLLTTIHTAAVKYKTLGFSPPLSEFLDMQPDHLLQTNKHRFLLKNEQSIINGLINKKDRIKLIRSNLGMVLTNTVFNDEIKSYKRKKRVTVNFINQIFSGKTFSSMTEIGNLFGQIDQGAYENLRAHFADSDIAAFALFCTTCRSCENSTTTWDKTDNTSAAIRWIKTHLEVSKDKPELFTGIENVKKKFLNYLISKIPKDVSMDCVNEDDNIQENTFDECALWEANHNELDDRNRYEFQQDALFWMPGTQRFWNGSLEEHVGTPEKPLFIAFFYTWLKQCSGEVPKNIAKELKVSEGTLSRWNPHILLRFPFLDADEPIFPVYFNYESRQKIGLYDTNIRVCKKPCYASEDKATIDPFMKRKKILWKIYEFVRKAGDLVYELDFLKKTGRMHDSISNKHPFSIQFCYNYEIEESEDLDTKNYLRQYVYITGITL